MKRLIIFEGPDGTGKTTLAKALATYIDAVYVHHGSYPEVTEDLANVYALSMMPAALGLRDVVLDRAWYSEVPYGFAYRWGADRIGEQKFRGLEDLAANCTEPLVVLCDTSFENVERSFRARQEAEYLDNTAQLHQVWYWYRTQFRSDLPLLRIEPFTMLESTAIERILECA